MSETAEGVRADREAEDPFIRGAQEYLRQRRQKAPPTAAATDAWNHFYFLFSNVLCDLARRYPLRSSDAEDLIQDVWKQVLRSLPDFQWDHRLGGFCTWLARVAHSRALDRLRRRKRKPTASLEHARAAGLEPVSREEGPAVLAERKGEREALHEALARVRADWDARSYEVLHRHALEGQSFAEAAAAVGLTEPQAWSRHHRLLRKLRIDLAAHGMLQ
jgi:RNA polymerase sigma-70 factor (ECF subfamily)